MYKKIVALMLAFAPVCSYAVPVRWTLEDVLLGIGLNPPASTIVPPVSLTGSFVYDADFNQYSNINITSADGLGIVCDPARLEACFIIARPPFPSQHYDTPVTTAALSATELVAVDGAKFNGILDGDTVLVLLFSQALTNAGGVVGLAPGGVEYFCANLACAVARDGEFRGVLGPQAAVPSYQPRVVGVAVSEPQTFSLLATGFLLLMVGIRRYGSSPI